jgi:hypothetical protein
MLEEEFNLALIIYNNINGKCIRSKRVKVI